MSSKEDNERAKRIMHEDQLSALHNLTIASYLLDAQSDKNKTMSPGDRCGIASGVVAGYSGEQATSSV